MWNLRTVVMSLEKGVQFFYSSLVSFALNVVQRLNRNGIETHRATIFNLR